jgi:hypothetical protein
MTRSLAFRPKHANFREIPKILVSSLRGDEKLFKSPEKKNIRKKNLM